MLAQLRKASWLQEPVKPFSSIQPVLAMSVTVDVSSMDPGVGLKSKQASQQAELMSGTVTTGSA